MAEAGNLPLLEMGCVSVDAAKPGMGHERHLWTCGKRWVSAVLRHELKRVSWYSCQCVVELEGWTRGLVGWWMALAIVSFHLRLWLACLPDQVAQFLRSRRSTHDWSRDPVELSKRAAIAVQGEAWALFASVAAESLLSARA